MLDLVSAGNWVINSTKTPSEVKTDYEELHQYILSYCEKYGFPELVDYEKKDDRYYESREYEESAIHQMIDDYDNDVFWDKLTLELAKRDVAMN
ncbi:MAG: hypothetical protein FH758_06090 [Firmicutes bacterium]|nr:hypothetical protein [Bacillota bacterium]